MLRLRSSRPSVPRKVPTDLAWRRAALDVIGVAMLALLGATYQLGAPLALAAQPATETLEVSPAATAYPAVGPTAARTPASTEQASDACATDRPVFTRTLPHVAIKSYCGVTAWEEEQVAKYVTEGLEAAPVQLQSDVELFVFTDLEKGAAIHYDWLRIHGDPDVTYSEVRESWDIANGKADRGAAFIYLDQKAEWSITSAGIGEVVLHEVHHIVQFELSDSNELVGDWLVEGGAEYFSLAQLYHRSSSDPRFLDSLLDGCDYSLDRLEQDETDMPLECRYVEGERAVALLVDNFGAPKYYELFPKLGSGRAFGEVFAEVYGMPLSSFYQSFDGYRKSGYRTMPVLVPVQQGG